jgi:glycine cleavage system protein P-like pyridoxal-binding family
LAQDTLGMMGISLLGMCTMKHNPRSGEAYAWARALGAV